MTVRQVGCASLCGEARSPRRDRCSHRCRSRRGRDELAPVRRSPSGCVHAVAHVCARAGCLRRTRRVNVACRRSTLRRCGRCGPVQREPVGRGALAGTVRRWPTAWACAPAATARGWQRPNAASRAATEAHVWGASDRWAFAQLLRALCSKATAAEPTRRPSLATGTTWGRGRTAPPCAWCAGCRKEGPSASGEGRGATAAGAVVCKHTHTHTHTAHGVRPPGRAQRRALRR
jgi:hypothetical protein